MRQLLILLVCILSQPVQAAVTVTDDLSHQVTLDAPASRLITLAPHLAELVYAAGAGETLVAVSAYSNYPDAVSSLPEVGDALRVDIERIVALKPDAVLAWASGTPVAARERLEALGIPVVVFSADSLSDIAAQLTRIGILTGRPAQAARAATAFTERLKQLRAQYAGQSPVRVFIQIDDRPLFTVNGRTTMSEVVRLCGGRNIFAELDTLAPQVSLETVLARDPQAIIGTGEDETAAQEMLRWLAWQDLAAARATNLFLVPPDLLARDTPRILDGAQMICEDLEEARGRLIGKEKN